MDLRRAASLAAALPLVWAAACTDGEPGSTSPDRDPTVASPSSISPSAPSPAETQPPSQSPESLLDEVARTGPTRARTPAEVVRQIVVAEDAIADPATTTRVLQAAGRLQQLAYRVLGGKPRWDAEVRASLPARLRWVVARNVTARRAFRSMHPEPSDELPAWRIVRPAPARELKRHYVEAERRFGVDWEYLAAVHLVETAMGRIRGVSTAGAQGPMQFLQSTWEEYGAGGDINSTRDAILAAGRFLRAQGFGENIAGALYRYNNSTAYVRGVTALATVMQQRPRAFWGYYNWEVYFLTSRGEVHLPVGYAARKPIPVVSWKPTSPPGRTSRPPSSAAPPR